MKKDIRYNVEYNGLVFSFDFAERSNVNNYLWFRRKCFYSDGVESVCFIDLDKCSFRFASKSIELGLYYFDIVPVGGANIGK